jgi:hypothetical protein
MVGKLNGKMKALYNLINDMNGTVRREGGWLSGCDWGEGSFGGKGTVFD